MKRKQDSVEAPILKIQPQTTREKSSSADPLIGQLRHRHDLGWINVMWNDEIHLFVKQVHIKSVGATGREQSKARFVWRTGRWGSAGMWFCVRHQQRRLVWSLLIEMHKYRPKQISGEAADQIQRCGTPEHNATESACGLTRRGIIGVTRACSRLKLRSKRVNIYKVAEDQNTGDDKDPILMV